MQSWTRLYRPRRFQDLHLTSVRQYFLELLQTTSFPRVMLFAGPKGTGKTSVARIIGALLNDPANAEAIEQLFFSPTPPSKPIHFKEPECELPAAKNIFEGNSMLVQEIDAASNRGIDDIRALKERVHIPPMGGSIAVYILDEAHMLTTEAFNALLKLLEEPPQHAVFILATTELHKIPATVASRAHVVQFQKASAEELHAALEPVIKNEKLEFSPETLAHCISMADGSFRDAVKLLESMAHHSDSSSGTLQSGELLQTEAIAAITSVIEKDSASLVELFARLRQAGTDEQHFLKKILELLHRDLASTLTDPKYSARFSPKVSIFLLQVLCDPALAKTSPIPFLRLEISLLELIEKAQRQTSPHPSTSSTPTQSSSPKNKTTKVSAMPREKAHASLLNAPQTADSVPASTHVSELSAHLAHSHLDSVPPATKPDGDGALICSQWESFVTTVSEHNFGLAALLRSATPVNGGRGVIELKVYYLFHKEQLLQPKWMAIIDQVATQIAGGRIEILCQIAEPPSGEVADALDPTLHAAAVEALL